MASSAPAIATSPTISDLVALDPAVRIVVGTVHAHLDLGEFTSINPALWVWTTDGRVPPTFVHEASLDGSLQQALTILTASLSRRVSRRVSDEAEGGIIIPDYMY